MGAWCHVQHSLLDAGLLPCVYAWKAGLHCSCTQVVCSALAAAAGTHLGIHP